MKKVFFILVLFLSCYFIYNKTIDKKLYYLTIGDALSKGINEYGVVSYGYNDYVKDYLKTNNRLKEYNKIFTDSDYWIRDIVNILSYNQKKGNNSLNRLIKKADIITISLGMNEIYYKIEKNNENIYTYIDNMINDYSKILGYISNFHHDKVYILGYYNAYGKNNDIFNYANHKLKEITKKNNFIYVDLSNIFDNNPNYFPRKDNFIPNIKGYEKISQIIVENLQNN
ncbi:MAG: SGNH/GDSL hydrolase family protein [Bacilli bacterium]|nr:SGNH/GDSL hydrolase family protein [Bacilli bacterium]